MITQIKLSFAFAAWRTLKYAAQSDPELCDYHLDVVVQGEPKPVSPGFRVAPVLLGAYVKTGVPQDEYESDFAKDVGRVVDIDELRNDVQKLMELLHGSNLNDNQLLVGVYPTPELIAEKLVVYIGKLLPERVDLHSITLSEKYNTAVTLYPPAWMYRGSS